METNLHDPKNIAGLSSLLHDDDIDSNMDLAELEREIANGIGITPSEDVNIAEDYRKEMDMLSRNFDIGMAITEPENHTSDDFTPTPINITQSPRNNQYTENSHTSNPPYEYNTYDNSHIGSVHDDISHQPNTKDRGNWDAYEPIDNQLRNMTIEERKQDRISNVLKDIDDGGLEFNIDKEREEDDKTSLLEQIDMLKITLEDDGVDISGVPTLSKGASIKDVQNVYKILRLKNDRNRYCSFAEEIILSGAYGMEYLFDGEKKWFGRTPDLTEWSSTVKIKLRRMRFETSTFVQEVMQQYNMSAGVRLALELLPSMFLYSRSRRLSQNDTLVSDDQYKNAISKLNSV